MPSSVQIFTQAITDFKRIQSDLADIQSKIGAENKASTFKELGNDITTVQNFSTALKQTERFIATISTVDRRLDATYRATSQIIDTAIAFKESLTLEASINAGVNDLQGAANAALNSIEGALNSKDGANFLFSGSQTNQKPIATPLRNQDNNIDGEATANYYSGDNFVASADVSAGVRLEYGVTAADPAFQNLISAINLAKESEESGNLEEASLLFDEALTEVIQLRSRMGDNTKTLQQTLEFHDRAAIVLEEKLSNANSPDIVELTIQSASTTATLQASLQLFSRISSLRLTDFL